MSERPLTPASLRQRAGLTQREVAVSLGKREATISEWERGVSYPSLTFREIHQLTLLYKCTLAELAEAFDGFTPQ